MMQPHPLNLNQPKVNIHQGLDFDNPTDSSERNDCQTIEESLGFLGNPITWFDQSKKKSIQYFLCAQVWTGT